MAVPESIRQVPRPSNTVVIDSGSNGLKRYAVHSRTKVVYTPGRNPRPVNGPVIGHIIGGKFVPVVSGAKLAPNGPDRLLPDPGSGHASNRTKGNQAVKNSLCLQQILSVNPLPRTASLCQ